MLMVSFYAYAQSIEYNYIKTVKVLDWFGRNKNTSIQYYDEFGRPVITTTNALGSRGVFCYTSKGYDNQGREFELGLPVIGTTSSVFIDKEEYSALASNTYNTMSNNVYSHTYYDYINRPVFVSVPGAEWSNKGKSIVYGSNSKAEVKKYTAPLNTGSLVFNNEYYPSKTLFCEGFMDEDDKKKIVFKDYLGRKILEKKEESCTYYVYNDLGQLRFVLSPEFQYSGNVNETAYEYRYDKRGNVIMKKLPGCKYIQYWYDDADRLTFMQDQRLRDIGKYRFFLYDGLGRLAIQGLCSDIKTKDDGVEGIPAVTYYEEAAGFLNTGYSFNSTELMKNPELELVSYYDGHLGNGCFSILANSTKLFDSFANQVIEGKLASISSGKNLPARLISGYPGPPPVPFDTTGMTANIADTIPFLKRLPKSLFQILCNLFVRILILGILLSLPSIGTRYVMPIRFLQSHRIQVSMEK